MKRKTIKDWLRSASENEFIEVEGWVRSCRRTKQVFFVALSDGSTHKHVQIVGSISDFPEELLKRLHTGASLRARGVWTPSVGTKQAFDLVAEEIEVWETVILKTILCSLRSILFPSCGNSVSYALGRRLLGLFFASDII